MRNWSTTRRFPSASALIAVGAVFFAALFFAGCSKQGEGERCSIDNLNDDCAEGLVCGPRGTDRFYLCCPPDPRSAADPRICGPSGSITEDGGVDTGTAETAGDAAPDAPDAPDATDAKDGADAPADTSASDASDGAADVAESG